MIKQGARDVLTIDHASPVFRGRFLGDGPAGIDLRGARRKARRGRAGETLRGIKALDLSRGEAGPARIDSAELIAEGSQQFCAVKGYVAPAVNFVVRLPTSGWTQRYLQLGCGGYCGGATLTSGSVDRQSSGCTAYDDKEMVIASSNLGHRRSGTFFPDGVTRALAFNTDVTRLTCPVLIPEGGADPLVPRASLSVFNTGNEVRRSRTLAWPDWQHSIYEWVDRHGI
jgi:hypothetical protein